ncbi:putative lipopolysaccharide heptosyltransferase III [Nitratifractor salsuginis]|uniref:Lipopolysaccharide heptosyltransferase III n=1 Tax=Nitratifractor salsuginis (strain DSM 16511 / JCM 12458 / E9I37-1) TaxID=749222 RepID=E6WZD4_NITSE|nr:putative lipopolysaccharide heptosyltransferase III [Nitratifractor salsuginis]ADV46646.1 lipopolysaccharide heptosyltransferase III [Nitratifractor salsuginis DSM 16511]
MKILISKFMHIGDVLLITPLLSNLKHYYPDASIDVALNEGTEEMLTLHPALNRLHIYRRSQIKKLPPLQRLKAELAYAQEIRKERYDLLINLTRGDRGLMIAAYSGAKEIVSFLSEKNPWLNRFVDKALTRLHHRHWVDINLDALRVLDREPLSKRVEIFWSESTDEKIDTLLKDHQLEEKKFIHFHPVSRWLFKCLADETAASLIDFCQNELSLPVVITAAPIKEERDKVQAILRHCQSTPIDLSGQLSLKETAALNKRSHAYIGVDTAIMHISAANDTPTLAFFGPSIPYAWGPWDNTMMHNGYRCYRGNQRMGKHQIIQKDWDCVPCDAKGCNNSGVSDCLIKLNQRKIQNEIYQFIQKIEL